VQNPINGQRLFIKAFEETCLLIQRFSIVECTHKFEENPYLEKAITELYCLILVHQASALRHLARHTAHRILSDTFNPEQWDSHRQRIDNKVKECNEALDDDSQKFIFEELEKQSHNIKDARSELRESFRQQLDEIRVTRSNLFT
jgi:hypothetical protein